MNERAGGWAQRHAALATIVAAVVGIVGVVVAILAWQLPTSPQAGGTAHPDATSEAGEAVAGPTGTATDAAGARYLTDLSPLAGQTHIEADRDARTFVQHCRTGTGDPSTEVQYTLRGRYREFAAEVVVSKIDDPDAAIQYEVFVDGRRISNTYLEGINRGRIASAELRGAQVLTLRLRCERSGTVVTIEGARVSP